MENKLPIISSDLPLHKKINQKYHTQILVNPLRVNEIANAIDYLADNEQTAIEMGGNGKKAVCDQYNWISQEKILIDFYKK